MGISAGGVYGSRDNDSPWGGRRGHPQHFRLHVYTSDLRNLLRRPIFFFWRRRARRSELLRASLGALPICTSLARLEQLSRKVSTSPLPFRRPEHTPLK